MPEGKQTGQIVTKETELKDTELKNTDVFEVEQIQGKGEIVREEQNHSQGNLARDAQKYPVAQLMTMAQMQMLESEMEKKYLLYHIVRQNLEMRQMKRQMGILPDLNHKFTDSVGLTSMSQRFRTRRRKTGRERFTSLGRNYTYDNSSNGGFSYENQEAWRMPDKLPDIPETPKLAPTNINWSNAAEQIPSKLDFTKEAFELGNKRENWDDEQITAWYYGNLGDTAHPINTPCEMNNSPDQKFNVELFKTEICRSWAEFGLCPYGSSCRFAHGRGELRLRPKPHWKYKTEMCKKYISGYCPYGSRCYFVHKPDEAIISGKRPMGVELNSEQNRDMTRRWHRKPTPFHPCKTQERI